MLAKIIYFGLIFLIAQVVFPKERKITKILFLGDSLTEGYGLPLEKSFPSLIQKKINEENLPYHIINAGKSGDTTEGGLKRLPQYFREKEIISHAIIALGSNDAMLGISLKEMEKNLEKIMDYCKDKNVSKIFLVELKTFPAMGSMYGNEYNQVFHRVAQKKKVILMPFFLENVVMKKELNLPDGIHPNEKGMEIVAQNVWNFLKNYLKP